MKIGDPVGVSVEGKRILAHVESIAIGIRFEDGSRAVLLPEDCGPWPPLDEDDGIGRGG